MKRILAMLTAGAMVFTNAGMDVLASTSIVVGGVSGGTLQTEEQTEEQTENLTETETESESFSETESETESETAAQFTDQKVFTCEGDQATVTVTVPDEVQMPAGSTLIVEPIVENSVAYDEIAGALTSDTQTVYGVSGFFMDFSAEGDAEIPEGFDYQVQIDYKDAVLAVPEGLEDSTVGVYVNLSGAAADVQKNESGAVEKVSLATAQLGDVAVVRTGAAAEEATKTVYTYEDENVIVTATIEKADAVPDDAKLVVKELKEGSREYTSAEEEIQKYAEEQKVAYVGYIMYDMHFEDAEGNEIEPEEGAVKVEVTYKKAKEFSDSNIDGGLESNGDDNVSILHLDESQGKVEVEDVTQNVELNEDGEVKGAEFETANFSTIVIAAQLILKIKVTAETDGTYYLHCVYDTEWGRSTLSEQPVTVTDGSAVVDNWQINNWTGKDVEIYLTVSSAQNVTGAANGQLLDNHTMNAEISDTVNEEGYYTVNIKDFKMSPGASETYYSILGNATYYGVVANEMTLVGHQETNFATGVLHNTASNVDTNKNEGGGAGTILIGEMDGSNLIIGLNGNTGSAVIFAGADVEGKIHVNGNIEMDYSTYSEDDIKKMVKNMVDSVAGKSNALKNRDGYNYSDIVYQRGDQRNVIDIAELGEKDSGTYYINFASGEFSDAFTKGTGLVIRLKEGQNVVLNIPDTSVSFRQYVLETVKADGSVVTQTTQGAASEDNICQKVIFNCYNAKEAETANATSGMFLVPYANFKTNSVAAGWLIANVIDYIGGQEWHFVLHDMPTYTQYAIRASKTIDGNVPSPTEKGKFTFKLFQLDEDGNATLVDTKTNETGGLINFDTFGNVSEIGTYWYKIVEEGSVEGYNIDQTVYYAEVVVNNVAQDGKVVGKDATVTYHKGSKNGETSNIVVFNNSKQTEDKGNLKVTKSFADATLTEEQKNAIVFTVTGADYSASQTYGEFTNGSWILENLPVGEYTVTESNADVTGYTRTTTYSVENGRAEVVKDETVEVRVSNSYTRDLGSLELKKVIAGDKSDADLTDAQKEKMVFTVTGPDGYRSEVKYSEFTEGTYTLTDLPTGEYTVTETGADFFEDYRLDVTYSVEEGKFSVVKDEVAEITITNTYDQAVTEIEGLKKYVGENAELKAGEFELELKDTNDTVVASAFNDADGKFSLTTPTYKEVGEYSYTLSEKIPEEATEENSYTVNGIRYDSTTYDVLVKVSVNEETHRLEAIAEVNTENIIFTNIKVSEVPVSLEASKTLTGAALAENDFTFTLEEIQEDGTAKLLQTKTNDADGKVAFDDLVYDYTAEGKTFTYVVKETDTQKPGITYSQEAYTVTVSVSKADTEGIMAVETTVTDASGKEVTEMNFTNTFAGSVSLTKVGPMKEKLAGAKFMLYQQQPSTDYKAYAEEGYVTDAEGSIRVEGLPEGTYYFVETEAPEGYVISMNEDGTAKQYPFEIQAGKEEPAIGVNIELGEIENDIITPGEGGTIEPGSVTIEKAVLNAAGKTVTAKGMNFYAGVFSKNEDGTYTLIKSATLKQNGKVTITDLVVGTYYLFETTRQGDRIKESEFAFEITGNGQEFEIKADENTDVKLVNKEKETVETEVESETEKTEEKVEETKTAKSVKTGDTTPIALYVGLLAVAAVLIAVILFLRRRKNK